MTINEIGEAGVIVNTANGWEGFKPDDWPANGERDKVHFLCTHMALVHTEVAEATEAVRHRDRANFDEELADVIIRVATIARGLGIDLDIEVAKKLDKNSRRGLHHGGKAI